MESSATGREKQPHNLSVVRCTGTLISKRTISRGVLLSLQEQHLHSNPNQKRPFTDLAKPDASIRNTWAASSTRKGAAGTLGLKIMNQTIYPQTIQLSTKI